MFKQLSYNHTTVGSIKTVHIGLRVWPSPSRHTFYSWHDRPKQKQIISWFGRWFLSSVNLPRNLQIAMNTLNETLSITVSLSTSSDISSLRSRLFGLYKKYKEGSPALPWASQRFLHFQTKRGEPFTWETQSWLGRRVTRLTRSHFVHGRVTLLAATTFFNINTGSPTRINSVKGIYIEHARVLLTRLRGATSIPHKRH